MSDRERALEHHGRQCDQCGGTENIEVHHIDGDPTNNSLDNLLPLCRGCHSRVHSGELQELSEKVLPKDERTRRVTYMMEPPTQEAIERIMWLTDSNTEKEAIQIAVREYVAIYERLESTASELPDPVVSHSDGAPLPVTESVISLIRAVKSAHGEVEAVKERIGELLIDATFPKGVTLPQSD